MAKMKEIICACGCKRKKLVRVADIKRGWGKYYSKSCKAVAQEKRTGQHAALFDRLKHEYHKYDLGGGEWDYIEEHNDSVHPFSSEAIGQD